jgi:hypothetical protein
MSEGLLDEGPEGLDEIFPGLTDIYEAIVDGNDPMDDFFCEDIAFKFHVTASAGSWNQSSRTVSGVTYHR